MAPARNLFFSSKSAGSVMLALLLASPGVSAAQAQTAQDETRPIAPLQVESNLVTVRVVVRDAHGQPVEGLTKEDFRLLDRGKEQTISHFEPVAAYGSAAATSNPPHAQAGTTARYLAFVFDTLDISDAEIMQARKAAESYLVNSLKPGDHLAIFDSEKMLTGFTTDSGQMHTALASLSRSLRAPQRLVPCPRLSPYQAFAILHGDSQATQLALEEARNCFAGATDGMSEAVLTRQIVAQAHEVAESADNGARINLQMLEAVTGYLSQAPGERVVVVISPGFISETEQNQLDRIVEKALHAQTVINSLDPKGLANLARAMDPSRGDAATTNDRLNVAIRSFDSAQQFSASDVLADLARGTGGQFFHNENDLKAGFDLLAGHPAEYMLAFVPRDLKQDGKFHELKVMLREKQEGVTLLARRGYFASADRQRIAAAEPAGLSSSETSAGATRAAASLPPVAASVPAPTAPRPAERKQAKLFTAFKVKKITVAQLKDRLTAASSEPDLQLAAELRGYELTERLRTAEIARMRAALPGPESQSALLALGDQSAFLALPQPEIAEDAPLSAEEQHKLLAMAADYVHATIARLPNLTATREGVLFADRPATHSSLRFFPGEPLQYVKTTSGFVFYKNGRENLDVGDAGSLPASSSKAHSKETMPEAATEDLASSGQFGPVLAKVLADIGQGRLQWGYWEKTDHGNLPVFRYSVPRKHSHFNVQVSSAVYSGFAAYQKKERPGYHGEITLDPADGKITRLSVQAELESDSPLVKADLSVEYGPVELGGQAYICPLHSVVLAMAYGADAPGQGRASEDLNAQDSSTEEQARERASGAPRTLVSDVVFREYHLFRSEVRIIPANRAGEDTKP